ncbi:MAG TPA: CAP domain-containing protein [Candidatus Limnocylindrales bacterium]|nr:CAP domain-containing protein [Candidatus Limnocylindrales bacterium]
MLPALALVLLAFNATVPGAAATYTNDSYEVKLADYINDYRQARGLARLPLSTAYSYWANWRSYDMCKRRYFSHTIPATSNWPGGGNLLDYWRYRKLWAGGAYRFGEIIAYNSYTSGWLYTLFKQWKYSSIHNSMMLSYNGKYDRIGVGVYNCGNGRHYATVVFVNR